MRDVVRDSDDGGSFGIGPKTHIFDLFADWVLGDGKKRWASDLFIITTDWRSVLSSALR